MKTGRGPEAEWASPSPSCPCGQCSLLFTDPSPPVSTDWNLIFKPESLRVFPQQGSSYSQYFSYEVNKNRLLCYNIIESTLKRFLSEFGESVGTVHLPRSLFAGDRDRR